MNLEVSLMKDKAMRLDIFVYQLSNKPNTKGVIRIYGGNEDCFLCRYFEASWFEAYLKNTRKFSSERYLFEYCDENEKSLQTQLYLLPIGLTLPRCEETVESPKKLRFSIELIFTMTAITKLYLSKKL